jgi:hypothetical protein
MAVVNLAERYESIRAEATTLAGELTDLARRAAVYRHLFLASGGNHAFPLIAAHGALWAGGYFRMGLRLGRMLSWQYLAQPELRQAQLQKLDAFADLFRDINRRVCIDTYTSFHLTRLHGDHPDLGTVLSPELIEPLNRIHAANARGRELTETEKRMVFEAHFRHEQRNVVGPTLTEGVAKFDWPLVRAIALRPPVRFAYFPLGKCLWFRNFADQDERIEKGLEAMAIASRIGWRNVDAALQKYAILPAEYFQQPAAWFAEFRRHWLPAA